MVNQWGRDGTVSSGSARSGGGGGLIIAAVVALVIGAGGGYVGARFLSGVSSADIAARDKKIAELNQTLSEMKFDDQGATAQQNQRIKDLEAQVLSLQHTKESLKQYAEQKASQADSDAQAEIAALRKTIEEAGDVSAKLNRAQKSLKVSELQIIELEQMVKDQKSEIAKLQAAVQQGKDDAAPAVVLLQGQKAELQAQLDEANRQAALVPGLKAQIGKLNEQLSARADSADAEARQQIAALRKENDALQAKVATLSAAAGDTAALNKRLDEIKMSLVNAEARIADKDSAMSEMSKKLQETTSELATASGNAEKLQKTVAELQGKLDEMAESLADRDRTAREATQNLKQARDDLSKAGAQVQDLRQQKQVLDKTQDDLNTQIAALNATIAQLKAAAASDNSKPATDDSNQTSTDDTDGGLTPRDRGDVEKAVADLPGYANLDADKQQTLVDMLQRGECVTDSLKAAYGHVSPISLRSLFRDLGGHC